MKAMPLDKLSMTPNNKTTPIPPVKPKRRRLPPKIMVLPPIPIKRKHNHLIYHLNELYIRHLSKSSNRTMTLSEIYEMRPSVSPNVYL